jgi:hypothetical protein
MVPEEDSKRGNNVLISDCYTRFDFGDGPEYAPAGKMLEWFEYCSAEIQPSLVRSNRSRE